MNETKERLTFRPEAETRRKIEYWYGQDGCRSMNDFIEKAVNFYIGYLEAGDKNTYLPKVLRSIIDGSIGKFEDRMSHLMFKQSVETDMMATLTAHDPELSEDQRWEARAAKYGPRKFIDGLVAKLAVDVTGEDILDAGKRFIASGCKTHAANL